LETEKFREPLAVQVSSVFVTVSVKFDNWQNANWANSNKTKENLNLKLSIYTNFKRFGYGKINNFNLIIRLIAYLPMP
jgi:hypothetical protein